MMETKLKFSSSVFPEAPVRAEDLQYLVNCIRQGECCSVVGPSNTGKSILLRSLLTEEVRQGCALEGAPPPVTVFVDCLDAGDTEQGFYELVLRRIVEELEGPGEPRAIVDTLRALHREVLRSTTDVAVRSLFASSMRDLSRATGIRLVLVLDEFDDVFRTLPPWPFRQLRALRDRFGARLCYVVATSRHLERLRSDAETYEFRELFHPYTRVLCPLCKEDARRFIAYLAETHGMVMGEKHTSMAIELSGGHPGLLTHVCRILSTWDVEQFPQRQTFVAELSKDQAVQKECGRLWEELEEEEREGLLILVGSGGSTLDADQQRALETKGLVTREDGGLTIFSPIFETFVKGELATQRRATAEGVYCNPETGQIWVDGREVTWQLSELQRKLVQLLCRKGGMVCTYDEIAEEVWGVGVGVSPAAIRELVARIRKKIPELKRYILIVPREGYRLETPE